MNGQGEEVELVENGKQIKVTNKNRKEYAKKVAKYYIMKDVRLEITEFLKGFYSVIPSKIISAFDSDELDFVMSGVPLINI